MNKKIDNRKLLQFFSALSDKTRLDILLTIMESPKTVNEIHRSLGKERMTLSAVSHQLTHMADLNIVVYERKGREKRFRPSNAFCWCIVKDALNHFEHEETSCPACSKITKNNEANKKQ